MATRDLPHFGDLLRRRRTAAALSQEQLAERAGLSVRGLSDLERGVHRAPRLETVRMLADALGLGEDDRVDLLAAARPEAVPEVKARPGRATLSTLPIPPTHLIGRETETAALAGLLTHNPGRLVTLTGPGGTGKTHLALEVAANVSGHYPDGVVFVDLSPITAPALVMPAILHALGLRETSGVPAPETVISYLRERSLLLVLDNCEQVLGTAPDIASLLATCPQLAILATSRESLRIRAEREYIVAPLPLPDPTRSQSLDDLERVAALALFVERARAVSADFALNVGNAAAVVAICTRLDGLPLAIELAAARVKVMPPDALLARLGQRLPLLTGGARDLPSRQRTMRDAIAWSYDLLSPVGQALFRRLSVFSGGFTLASAEAVVAAGTSSTVIDGISELIEQSLVRQAPDSRGQPRYLMLETVREFGLERLAAADEVDATRSLHALHFLGLSTRLHQGIWSDWNLDQLTDTIVEHDNLRLALTWFHLHGEGSDLLRLSAVTYGLWISRGLYSEGVTWVELALAQTAHVADAVRFQALRAVGLLALLKGDYPRATTCINEGVTLARSLGDPLIVAEALTNAGLLAYRRGEHSRADELLAESLALLQGLPDTIPDVPMATGAALRAMADSALAQEQFERTAKLHQRSLHTASNFWGVADGHAGLGAISYCQGDYVLAAEHYTACLDGAQVLGGDRLLVVTFLHGLAGIAAATGRLEQGARLLGAAESIRVPLGAPIFPRDQPVRDRCLGALMAALGEEQLAAAWEAGRTLTMAEAIAEAEAVLRPSD